MTERTPRTWAEIRADLNPDERAVAAARDELLTREMNYTRWDESCQDIFNLTYQCRRPKNHKGEHAAGFNEERLRWTQHEDET